MANTPEAPATDSMVEHPGAATWDFFVNSLFATPADWIMVILTLTTTIVGIVIAISVNKLAFKSERTATSQNIYQMWLIKKQLSMESENIAALDALIYSPEESVTPSEQERRIWIVLIIDILFTSFMASKKNLYSSDVFDADMRAHFGALFRYDPILVDMLLRTRGYTGDGVVGEFYDEAMRIRDNTIAHAPVSARYRYQKYRVFSHGDVGGNPLATFRVTEFPEDQVMQGIAREMNLSEIVFYKDLTDPKGIDARIFTPKRELDFAGHPIIGLLHHLGTTSTVVTVGGHTFNALRSGASVFTSPPEDPRILSELSNEPQDLADLIALNPGDIEEALVVRCGASFNMIELNSAQAVTEATLNLPLWASLFGENETSDIYLFHRRKQEDHYQIIARLFSPADGIMEDAATGSAAAALSAILVRDQIFGDVVINQGMNIDMPSRILLRVSKDGVMFGGEATHSGSGYCTG